MSFLDAELGGPYPILTVEVTYREVMDCWLREPVYRDLV
jgi:hypothetical protein